MKLNQRAKKLAVILLETSGDYAGSIHSSLQQIDTLIKKEAQFRSLLQSKRISDDKKTDILKEVLAPSCHPIAIEFLCLIAKEKSVQMIRQVLSVFDVLYKEKAGIVSVHAHVAKAIEATEIDALKQNLQTAMNKKADLKINVDGQLLGGIKLRIENTFLDASLQNKLHRLQGELLQS